MSHSHFTLDQLKEELFAEETGIRAQYDAAKRVRAFKALVHEQLRALRRHAKLTQESVADRMGVSQSVVSRLETDKAADITVETLFRFAEACGARPAVTFLPASGEDKLWVALEAVSVPWPDTGTFDPKQALDEIRRVQKEIDLKIENASGLLRSQLSG